jgi:hypothetical protein
MTTNESILNPKAVLSRFPQFELSYETISHKKVSEPYDIALAIPMGKKYYVWFTFDEKRNVCYLMEITRDKRVGIIVEISALVHQSMALGTVLYGTMVSPENSAQQIFVIEDIFYYKGVSIKHHTFSEKLGAIDNMFSGEFIKNDGPIAFALPLLWCADIFDDVLNKIKLENCGYVVHHVQYRSLAQTMPYINISAKPKTGLSYQLLTIQTPEPAFYGIIPAFSYSKPQYKYPTNFVIKADVQFDIYHLFAYGQNKSQIYCGVAGIPNYEKSVFMNGLFRNIRENRNLDYIEESDDEEDFEDTRLDKYVYSETTLIIECIFNKKFKKWVPVRIASPPGNQVVHVSKL